ncbi:MAG: FAD-binding protein [Candidatus Tectomicrobia bacterium]|nr:FAD-binding protein [Candidatus Tectomicrobia bacterium]
METRFGRRHFLAGVAAGTAVLAFDPWHQSWLTAAHADHPGGIPIPGLDGELVVDPESLAEAADDFGHIIHRTPVAVLRPGSIDDIRQLVQFANRHHIQVAMRGQGHSTFGQAQTEAGVVIDSRTLHTVHGIGPQGAVVDAGVRWLDLLTATVAQGYTPPVLTDYLELSVGGVLQVGGIGGHSHHVGFAVDNVRELQVVTGEGHVVTCSSSDKADLFNAVLGGLGQFGLIVRAHLPLASAPTHARVFQLFYTDITQYVADQNVAVMDERFSYLEGQVVPSPSGGWMFMLEAASYYTPPLEPDNTTPLGGLRPDAGTMIQELTYFDWQNRLEPVVTALRQSGVWSFPHPWFNVFLPGSQAVTYVSDVLATLTEADTGNGPILCYPFRRSKLHRPFVVTPQEEILYLFSLLRTAPPDTQTVDAMVAANRTLFEQARDLGGTHYPIGSIPFSQADWIQHFGANWQRFLRQKARYDPRQVLTPGQGIFTA